MIQRSRFPVVPFIDPRDGRPTVRLSFRVPACRAYLLEILELGCRTPCLGQPLETRDPVSWGVRCRPRKDDSRVDKRNEYLRDSWEHHEDELDQLDHSWLDWTTVHFHPAPESPPDPVIMPGWPWREVGVELDATDWVDGYHRVVVTDERVVLGVLLVYGPQREIVRAELPGSPISFCGASGAGGRV